MTDILQQPEFQTYRDEYRWRYVGDKFKPATEFSVRPLTEWVKSVAEIIEIILWGLVGFGIVLAIIYGLRWFNGWSGASSKKSSPNFVENPELYQQEKQVTQLPTDIAKQAWALWQSGEKIAALSLLYRGALAVMITRDGLTVEDSATEGECLQLVRRKLAVDLAVYFTNLTRVWQAIAYAQRLPEDKMVQQLCTQWQQHFG